MSSDTFVPWRGLHHVALVTPDLDVTARFYGETLGMEVGELHPPARGRGRHRFVKPGTGDDWGLHFFEHPDVSLPIDPDTVRAALVDPAAHASFGFLPGTLQHVAFSLPDGKAGQALRARLERAGVPMTPVFEQGPISSFVFADPFGTLLEAAWLRDADGDAAR